MTNTKTLTYYNQNATTFVQGTVDVAFTDIQDRFLGYLPSGGRVLDFGCGAGRDTKYFLEKGYAVDATDGSEELCRLASAYTGIAVKQQLFSELEAEDLYDGIWACASILHLSKAELLPVLRQMIRAGKAGAYIYMSFKYGTLEGYRNDRYFTDFTEQSFVDFMKAVKGVCVKECWVTGDARPGRGEEKWLNLILQKTDMA